MGIIGVICLALLLYGAYQKIFGGPEVGNAAIGKAIFLAVFAPVVICLLGTLVGAFVNMVAKYIIWSVLLVPVVGLIAWVKFVNRKRSLDRWLGETPVSAKKHIEED